MVVGVSAIIIRDKKIFLTKRPDYFRDEPSSWCCPGGLQEEGETKEDTVIREVMEEVGLKFIPIKILSTYQWKDRDLYRYLGNVEEGEVKMQEEEVVEYGWFSYNEAKDLKFAFEYREVLEKLHKEGLI